MVWDEFRESLNTPGKVLACGLVFLLLACWNHVATHAPSDNTPLHTVEGKLASTETTATFHPTLFALFNAAPALGMSRGWFRHIVTLDLADGQRLHYFFVRELVNQHNLDPLSSVPTGTSIQAEADDGGEIWELSADGREVVSLDATLARDHRIRHFRNVVDGILVLLGLGMLGLAALRRKPA